METPSLKQALNRMLDVHARLLAGETLWAGARDSAAGGWMRARKTLLKWGALTSEGTPTAFGQELLAAWQERHRAWSPPQLGSAR